MRDIFQSCLCVGACVLIIAIFCRLGHCNAEAIKSIEIAGYIAISFILIGAIGIDLDSQYSERQQRKRLNKRAHQ